MTKQKSHSGSQQRSRSMQLRTTVLGCFCPDADAAIDRLESFTHHEWQRNYSWMDAHGLVLYLLDRLTESRRQDVLPPSVLARFEENAMDNAARTDSLFSEAIKLREGFARAGVPFAVLKGFTLSPESVARPALRCQLDLDFLIVEADSAAASKVLGSAGYKLDTVSGDTWEFTAGTGQVASIRDLYKTKPQRSAELHLVRKSRAGEPVDERLLRAESRVFNAESFPALSAADSFLEQALHLYSHVSSPFTRTSWLLEFRQHVRARTKDMSFWRAAAALAADLPQAPFAIGMVTLLAEECFGEFAPNALRSWTTDQLGSSARLWIKNYGHRYMLANFPGTKLYLLLQDALGDEAQVKRGEIRKRLLPVLRPRMISRGGAKDSVAMRLRRSRMQTAFFFARLRFHAVEGFRYSIEYSRWRRHIAGSSH